ncbi:2-hydroxyacid dehydrogenase [Hansschlegelia quercus]|nr:glyoxylate/hydroxypyruvate reductase A [Hansschlegelia quercus]
MQADIAADWVEALAAAMPSCRFVPFRDLSSEDRRQARVAVVADPEPSELLELPSLRWVQSLWAGVERLMKEAPSDLHVVRMIDPMLAQSMANAVLAWTLYLYRDMPRYRAQQAARVWRQHALPEQSDTPVGILGLGALGSVAAQSLAAQGFPVLGWSRRLATIEGVTCLSGSDGLEHLLRTARIIVVLLPLTDDTRGMLGRDELALAQRGAALINFGRGSVVDSEALLAALDAGQLSHAVLDVFDEEPLPDASPLWGHERVTILPHISAPTNMRTASKVVAANVGGFLTSGTLPAGVDRTQGY